MFLWVVSYCFVVFAVSFVVVVAAADHPVNQQRVSRGRICLDNRRPTCCHTEAKVADQTVCLLPVVLD